VVDECDGERAAINRCYTSVSELGMRDRIADSEYRLLRLLGCRACLWKPSLFLSLTEGPGEAFSEVALGFFDRR
jgi:hypothetical protein